MRESLRFKSGRGHRLFIPLAQWQSIPFTSGGSRFQNSHGIQERKGLLAQLDRAPNYGFGGSAFKSSIVHERKWDHRSTDRTPWF